MIGLREGDYELRQLFEYRNGRLEYINDINNRDNLDHYGQYETYREAIKEFEQIYQ